MKIGTLEIDLKAHSKQFEAGLSFASKQLEKFGKFGLDVVSKNNEQFAKLRDTFGDVGLGIGLAADAFTELTEGKGRLGLLNMIRDTRVLGHSIRTWINVGALEATKLWEGAAFEIGNAWRDLGRGFDKIIDDVVESGFKAAKVLEKSWLDTRYALGLLNDDEVIKEAQKFEAKYKAWAEGFAQDRLKREARYQKEAIREAEKFNAVKSALDADIAKAKASDPEPVTAPDASAGGGGAGRRGSREDGPEPRMAVDRNEAIEITRKARDAATGPARTALERQLDLLGSGMTGVSGNAGATAIRDAMRGGGPGAGMLRSSFENAALGSFAGTRSGVSSSPDEMLRQAVGGGMSSIQSKTDPELLQKLTELVEITKQARAEAKSKDRLAARAS